MGEFNILLLITEEEITNPKNEDMIWIVKINFILMDIYRFLGSEITVNVFFLSSKHTFTKLITSWSHELGKT